MESARKARAALRRELLEFSRAHEWGRAATLKTLPAFLPIALTRVAAALAERAAETTRKGGDGAATAKAAATAAKAGGASLDAMPVSFRAHEAARISRAARVETAKADVANALVHGSGSEYEPAPAGRDAGRVDTNRRASASASGSAATTATTAATATTAPARSKLPSRGGVKRARGRGGRGWDTPAPDGPDDDRAEKKNRIAGAAATAKTHARVAADSGSRRGPPASLDLSRELGWSDVVLQRLLLEGVPERFLLEEGDLYLDAPGTGPGHLSGSAKRVASRGEEATARAAADRVRARVRAEAEGRDGNGNGDQLQLVDDATASRMDMEAIAAIPTRRSRRCFERRRRQRWRARWRGARWAGARRFSTREGRARRRGRTRRREERKEREGKNARRMEKKTRWARGRGEDRGEIKAEETNPNPGSGPGPSPGLNADANANANANARARRSTRRVRA